MWHRGYAPPSRSTRAPSDRQQLFGSGGPIVQHHPILSPHHQAGHASHLGLASTLPPIPMDTLRPPPTSSSAYALAHRLQTPSLTSTTSARSSTSSMFASGSATSGHDSGLGSTTVGGRSSPPPLIDLDDADSAATPLASGRRPLALDAGAGITPTDKLRALLRQMDAEVRAARPEPTPAPRQRYSLPPDSGDDEPTPVHAPYRRPSPIDVSPMPRADDGDYGASGSESPPSPPPRLTNAHMYSRRAVEQREREQREREREITAGPSTEPEPMSPPHRLHSLSRASASPPRRLPSRAVALRAAAAAAEAAEAASPATLQRQVREKSAPTPLENFIATTTHSPFPEPTSSRRPLSMSTPRAPRRASASPPSSPSPPRRSSKGKEPSYSEEDEEESLVEEEEPEPPRRRGLTPRRPTTIAAPPDTSASFAAGLKAPHTQIVDIEDDSDVPWREDDETIESSEASVPIDLNRGPAARLIVAEELSFSRSRESVSSASPRSPSTSRSFATATDGETLRQRRPSADTSLPALPDPESSEDDEEENSALRRRRDMFRPSKTPDSDLSSRVRSSRLSASRDATTYTEARSEVRSERSSLASSYASRYESLRQGLSRVETSPKHESKLGSAVLLRDESSRQESSGREGSSRQEPSRQESSLLAPSRESSMLEPLGRDSSLLDLSATRPTLLELSRQDSSLLASSKFDAKSSRRRRSFDRFDQQDDSETLGARRDFPQFDGDDFDELDRLPQSSPPRFSPRASLRTSVGKPGSLRSSIARSLSREWQEYNETEEHVEAEADGGEAFEGAEQGAEEHDEERATDEGEDDDGWAAHNGTDETNDSWRELEAAAALNPPSPKQSPVTPQQSSPALADCDTLPETPPTTAVLKRHSPSPKSASSSINQARNLLRAATAPRSEVAASSAPGSSAPTPLRASTAPGPSAAPTPLRSALRIGREPRFAPASPSVRWSPDVVDNSWQDVPLVDPPQTEQNEPRTPRRGSDDREPEPSTSPRSSPPRHLAAQASVAAQSPADPVTPVRAPALSNHPLRTPKPPGAWVSPARDARDVPPISGLPPSTPLPPPPVTPGQSATAPQTPGLPTPKPPGAWYSPGTPQGPAQGQGPPTPAPPTPTQGLPTPRPPGAWFSPGQAQGQGRYGAHVPARMSRLRNEVRLDESVSSTGSTSDVSVHRIRLSPKRSQKGKGKEKADTASTSEGGMNGSAVPQMPPRRADTLSDLDTPPKRTSPTASPSRQTKPEPEEGAKPDEPDLDEPADGDTSWTARLKRAVLTPIAGSPTKATRAKLAEAQNALDSATRASANARSRVLAAQDAWRAAIASAPPTPTPAPEVKETTAEVAVRTARWGFWVGWAVLELFLLWGVFR